MSDDEVNVAETSNSAASQVTHSKAKKKRKSRSSYDDGPYRTAYENFTFTPIPSTGRPGTPHRYFAESYHVDITKGQQEQPTRRQIVHKHANGLCIVTAGSDPLPDHISSIDVSESPVSGQSRKQKRKQQAKMLKGKRVDGASGDNNNNNAAPAAIHPRDVLVDIKARNFAAEQVNSADTKDDESSTRLSSPPMSRHEPLYACVWGTVLEVNSLLDLQLLQKDPLLDGYIAVILPTGPFPPPPR